MRWLLSGILLFTASVLPAGEKPGGAENFREVRGLVLGMDGRPAADRTVHLVGLSRGAQHFPSEPTREAGWDFRTDAEGRFTAKLGGFRAAEKDDGRPGWGIYALVVDPEGREAGAVSPKILNFEANGAEAGADEWGSPVALPPAGLDLTLRIQKGVTLIGRVLDYSDPTKPLANVTVETYNDLHADTHTGRGGEIYRRRATTDENGQFAIAQIYPGAFSVAVGEDGEVSWLRTLQNGKWVDDVLDTITLSPDGEVGRLEIQAAARPLFRYFGKVADKSGKPVAGAKVTYGVSYRREPQTWEDYHSYRSTESKRDGTYEIFLATPWIRGMDAEAQGYQRVDRWKDDDSSYAPGEYGFELELK